MRKTGKLSATQGTRDIICPFFRCHSEREIRCEGVMDGTSTAIVFRRPKKKAFFKRTYCEGRCKACEIYGMLMEKYNDGDDT